MKCANIFVIYVVIKGIKHNEQNTDLKVTLFLKYITN